MPKISIVIPTRNRCQLLQHALACALSQTFDDFEVVVSDNSSSDKTREIVRSYNDPRLRIVTTDSPLSMPDSWEFAISHARGDYVTFLSDDDAIHPELLARVVPLLDDANLDVIVWPFGGIYYHDTYSDHRKHNRLEFCLPKNSVTLVSSKSVMEELGEFQFTQRLPRMLNCLCSKRITSSIRSRWGKVFSPIAPDYTSGVAILSQITQMVFVDDFLLIWGIGKESIGADQGRNRSAASETFFAEFNQPKNELYKYTPLSVNTISNVVANSILRMRADIGLHDLAVNWANYFVLIHQDLDELERNGGKVQAERLQLARVLDAQPSEIRSAVTARIKAARSSRHSMKARVGQLIGDGRFRKLITTLLQRESNFIACRGEDYGFSNIFECAQKIDEILSFQAARASC